MPNTKKRDAEYYSLGVWCHNIRQTYKGKRQKDYKLTTTDIKALEQLGFRWTLKRPQKSFDDWMDELKAFKEKHGHCDVPHPKTKGNKHKALSAWCKDVRVAYKKIKKGEKAQKRLTDDNIRELKKIGFRLPLVCGKRTI